MSDPTFDHVMIDIETMSLHPSKALILSIGMIEFTPQPLDGMIMGKHMLLLPSIEEQLILGRRVDRGTQKFWADQPEAARLRWSKYTGERYNVATTISAVRAFAQDAKCVWANGTQFDLSNIVGLAEDLGIDMPMWHYRAPRDMRTFCEETAQTRLELKDTVMQDRAPFRLVDHEPVSDCIKQAWQVWAHWQDNTKREQRERAAAAA